MYYYIFLGCRTDVFASCDRVANSILRFGRSNPGSKPITAVFVESFSDLHSIMLFVILHPSWMAIIIAFLDVCGLQTWIQFDVVCRCCEEPTRAPCSWKHHSPPWLWGCSLCMCSTPAGWCMASCTLNLATPPKVTNASCPSWQGTLNYRYIHSFFLSPGFSQYVYWCLWSLSPSVQLSIYTALQPNAEGGHTLIHKEDQFDVNSKFERFDNI